MFDPGSPQTKSIADLFGITLALGAAVFLLVTGLVVYAILKYRANSNDKSEPKQISGNNRLEIGWTIAPSLLAVGLLALTVIGIGNSDPAIPKDRKPDLQIIGHQWWWEYKYPDSGVITANELHIPQGKRLLMELRSADVIHDFWVPQLARKMDLVYEWSNYTWLESNNAGNFLGACAEYCGTQHAGMLIRVIADPPAVYDQWLAAQKAIPPAPTAPNQVNGAKLFQEQNCVSCHYIGGTNAQARVGPDLTHIGSRTTIGSGVINNTPENLLTWIRNPNLIKPGMHMPGNSLPDEDLRDIVSYLEALK